GNVLATFAPDETHPFRFPPGQTASAAPPSTARAASFLATPDCRTPRSWDRDGSSETETGTRMPTRGNRDQRIGLQGSDGFAAALLVLIASLALTLLGWRFLELQAERTVALVQQTIRENSVPAVPVSPDQLSWRSDPAIQFLLGGLGVSFMLFGTAIIVEAW